MRLKKGDVVLIVALLLTGCALLIPTLNRPSAAQVTVYAADREVFRCPLSGQESYTWREGENYVHIEVADGAVWVADASCPDRDCVHRGRQSRAGASIICLPNRVSVILSGEAGEDVPDAVLY